MNCRFCIPVLLFSTTAIIKRTTATGRLILQRTSDITSISPQTMKSFTVCDTFIKNNINRKIPIARYLENDPSDSYGSGHIPMIRKLILQMLVE